MAGCPASEGGRGEGQQGRVVARLQEPGLSPGGRWAGGNVPAGERTGWEQCRGEALPAKSQLPRGACLLSPEQRPHPYLSGEA